MFALDFGRLLAVTDRGLESSPGRSRPFAEIARWRDAVGETADPGVDATLGWLDGTTPAIATPVSVVSSHCFGHPESAATPVVGHDLHSDAAQAR